MSTELAHYARFARCLPLLLLVLLTVASALAVITLVSFEAIPGDGRILLRWETATEINNAGFFVRRSLQENGEYSRISPFIPSQGDGLIGDRYSHTDTAVQYGVTYYYLLEAIEHDQDVEFHGPISATLRITATPTETATTVPTPTLSPTPTPSPSPTATVVPTPTQPPSPTATGLPTNTPTPVPTPIPTDTLRPQPTDTPTPVPPPPPTSTPAPTYTVSPKPTDTATPVPTPVPTRTPTHTPQPPPTLTDTPTLAPTPTANQSAAPTDTASPAPPLLPASVATVAAYPGLEAPPTAAEPVLTSQPLSTPASEPPVSPTATEEPPSALTNSGVSARSYPDPALARRESAMPSAPPRGGETQAVTQDLPPGHAQPQGQPAGAIAAGDQISSSEGWSASIGRGLLSLVALAAAGGLYLLMRERRGP